MNTFGQALRISTFGESHGLGVGCVIDGFPAGIVIDTALLAAQMQRRKGGQTPYATPRKEEDKVEILSGVFDGKSTGAPIALFIPNTNTKSKDYETIKEYLRPGHADFTYHEKYGARDYRGGGRSSAERVLCAWLVGRLPKCFCKSLASLVRVGFYT